MNTLDIIIVAFLLFGFIKGLLRGLFVEVASLLALIVGIYGAIHFSYFVGNTLKDHLSWDEKYISLTAFALTFIGIVLVISLVGKVLTKLANFAALGILNTLLGGLFGILKIGLILSVIFIFLGKMNQSIPLVKKETLTNSVLYKPIKKMTLLLFPAIVVQKNDLI